MALVPAFFRSFLSILSFDPFFSTAYYALEEDYPELSGSGLNTNRMFGVSRIS